MKLFIKKGIALIIGEFNDTKIHKHHAIQIILSANSKYTLITDKIYEGTDILIVPSDIPHRFMGTGISVMLLIEPESKMGEVLKLYIAGNPLIKEIDKQAKDTLHLLSFKENPSITEYTYFFLKEMNLFMDDKKITDERINKVIEYINITKDKNINVDFLSKKIHLSTSRLQHLFKEQTGISMKRYLLWKKMIDGVINIYNGLDFTKASYEAGFSDSAHMSRTFSEMFGLFLSNAFNNSTSVQVFSDFT